MTWPDGFSNSIAVKVFLGRATILHGLSKKTQRMEQEEKVASKRRKTLQRELEWVRMAPKARQAKGKARLNSYDKLLNEDQKEKEQHLEIYIPNGPRLGNKVIEAQHVQKAFGEKVLFSDLNFMLPPNGIIGVIGPNGAGKTTLLRMLAGSTKPDTGEVVYGHGAKLGYFAQEHEILDGDRTVFENMKSAAPDLDDTRVRTILGSFLFSGDDVDKPPVCFPAVRRPVCPWRPWWRPSANVLLLDEPTTPGPRLA